MTPESTRDIYTKIASEEFGVPEDNVTPAMRKAAKEHYLFSLCGGS